jgi:cytochrome P450
MKLEWILVLSRFNESYRQARKLLDRSLRPATLASYRPMLETRTHNLLAQVSANPDELEAHLLQFVGIL